METAPLIEFKDVTKRFGSRTILDRVNLQIQEGQVTTIIGLSGTGKSVTLKHIIGLLKPDEGQVLYRGKPLNKMSKAEWNAYISRISYMFQNNALFDSMTVFENVALPLRQTTKLSKQEIEKRAISRIEQTELTEVAYKYPSELSGGMQKRAALARALVTDPQIVLFDEPTTGQDPIRKNAILVMVAQYQKRFGFTAVLISHEIPDVFFISNRIVVLWDKKIAFQGTPEEMDRFDHPFRDEFARSLEGLEEELTGLYSRRHFKVRYQSDLSNLNPNGTYAVAVFSVAEIDAISQKVGSDVAQQMVRTLGSYISKHFGAVGGFSSRQTINEYATVLPNSNLEEAGRILADFTKDLQEHGMESIEELVKEGTSSQECYEFTILGGLAQGNPQIELESVMEFARFKLEPIASFTCNIRRK
jgi:phospholipid/cholesterol/gamma-HCH transport system ATP-binding protein